MGDVSSCISQASQLESLSAERSALRLQLENESRRVAVVERQLKAAMERTHEDDDVTVDVERGSGDEEDETDSTGKLRARTRPISNNFRVVTQVRIGRDADGCTDLACGVMR